ncbi:RodZ domain-containing protein [Marinobacter sp. HN1S83]|uniref:RodZ domain-containing protein n=1 Tax=Marinobacter sp. HN1S83 TaxID=3382301 RepID=UPI00387B431D
MSNEESAQQPVGESAGSLLRRGREKKGLSVSDVADAQHLRPAVIQAIEDGDYQQIDSELFLKGYVRAYAKQVGLEADSVVAVLDRELEPLRLKKAEALEANPLVDIERRRRQKRRFGKILILLVAVLVAAYLVLRFIDDGTSETEAPPEQEQQQDSEQDAGSLQEPEPEPAVDDSEARVRTDDELPAEDTAAAPASTVGETTDEAFVTADEPEAADTEIPVAAPALTESARTEDASDAGRLQISFSSDCWIEVTDSAGARLVSSLQREGDRVDVTGQMPLNVVIGAVDAVADISFQGEPVDMSEYRVVNNRAQFTLEI